MWQISNVPGAVWRMSNVSGNSLLTDGSRGARWLDEHLDSKSLLHFLVKRLCIIWHKQLHQNTKKTLNPCLPFFTIDTQEPYQSAANCLTITVSFYPLSCRCSMPGPKNIPDLANNSIWLHHQQLCLRPNCGILCWYLFHYLCIVAFFADGGHDVVAWNGARNLLIIVHNVAPTHSLGAEA